MAKPAKECKGSVNHSPCGPDVILLDLSMPNLSGLGAAPRMLQVSPDSKILMFSQYNSASIVTASLHAGALGYVVKSDAGKT